MTSKWIRICFLMSAMLAVGACTYDSQSLNAVRCDVPNQRDGERVCKDGIWVQATADASPDLTVDMSGDMVDPPDMPPKDMKMDLPSDMMVDMPPDMMTDMGQDQSMDMPPDMMVDMPSDMMMDMCTPVTDDEICKDIDAYKIQCGSATVTDNCGQSRAVNCGDNCPFDPCNTNTNTCPGCVPKSDAELCNDNNVECGTTDVTDNCTMMPRTVDCGDAATACGADEVCNNNTCECPQPDCSNQACGMATNACSQMAVVCPDTCAMANNDTQCNTNTNQCECAPAQCPANAQCGEVTNLCGNTTQCGSGPFCNNNQVCANFQCQDVTLAPASNQNSSAYYGWSVALSGDTIVVGEPGRSLSNLYGVGRVYVYVRDATTQLWTLQTTLEPPVGDHVDFGFFGWSVAIDGDLLAVGMRGADQNQEPQTGAVYVYRRTGTTWSAGTKLQPSAVSQYDFLGHSVAVQGDQVFAGLPGRNRSRMGSTTFNVGSVFYWTCGASLSSCAPTRTQLTLTNAQADGGTYFGAKLAVSQGYLLIGAPQAINDAQLGDVYVYKKQGNGDWTQELKVQMADRSSNQEGGNFGHGLAVQWPHIAIGQPGFTDVEVGIFGNQRDAAGRVFTDNFSSYTSGSTVTLGPDSNNMNSTGSVLTRPGAGNGPDGNGVSVAMANNLLVSGALDADLVDFDTGEVSLWRLQNGAWVSVGKLAAPTPSPFAYFGVSVATDGRWVVVGAPGRFDDSGNTVIDQNGAVHIYEVRP